MVKCNSTHKQKFKVLKCNGKFLFIKNFTFTFTGVTNGVTMEDEMKR